MKNQEEARVKILEFMGWSDLNRDSKLGGFRALRGVSPEGIPNQVAPNPLTDLNCVRLAVLALNTRQRNEFFEQTEFNASATQCSIALVNILK